ncbi:lactonase family protein [Actinoplanes solisilvae]|uniref:lactonase family protein n=1 Tax=Actinoplanes solisilvae TaxID=2486853 RepID=UPI000FDA646D|nr:lactonase family protein [Actinoplanes solisilvae]
MIIGSYTAEMDGKGTGLVVPGGVTTPARSPSYLIKDDRFLYAVNETDDGAVSSFALDTLELVSTTPTGGVWPCHLALHPSGYVLAANYGSGSVSVHPVNEGVLGAYTDLVFHEGSGPNADRQEGPHAHQVVVHADGTLTVVDLGIDRLLHYTLADGRLTRTGETAVPPGTGPRHFVVHPSGRWYVVGELSSTVLALDAGVVVEQESTTSSSEHSQPSAIVLDGDLLYVANRGVDTIAVFELSPTLRRVAEVPCGGTWPRDLAVSGGQIYVANQQSDEVVTFTAGRNPEPTGEVFATGSPTCVLP